MPVCEGQIRVRRSVSCRGADQDNLRLNPVQGQNDESNDPVDVVVRTECL